MTSSSTPSLQPFLSRCDNITLYGCTCRIIPELALLGCTDVAARVLSRLNNYDLYHDSHPNRNLSDLFFLWDLRAKKDGVPWPEGEEDKVQRAVRVRRAKTEGSDVDREGRDDGMVTLDDIQRELELRSYESDRPPTIARMLIDARDIIQSFETASSTPKIHKVRPGLLQALDLVLAAEAHHGKHNEGQALHLHGAPSSEELLRWLALSLGEKYHENFRISRSREAWKLYKSGALRRALNVDEAALAAFADDFETALTERLTNGRSRPATPHSVPELLEAAEHITQAVKTNPDVQDYYAYARRDTTLFSSPATEEQIAEAEARLGITLPSDYTAFLRLSNGTTGHIWGHPLGDYQPLFHSVDKLRWLDPVEEDYFAGLNLDLPARWYNWPFAPPPTAKGFGDYPEHFVIGRALEIGTEDIDNVWLLPPSTVTPIKDAVKKLLDDESLGELEKNSVRTAILDFAGSEDEWEKLEWACVTWASGGTAAMFIYPGFTAYLQDVVVKGRIEAEVQDEDAGQKMLRSGRWLGSLFGKRGEIEEQNVPEWLRDAIKAG